LAHFRGNGHLPHRVSAVPGIHNVRCSQYRTFAASGIRRIGHCRVRRT